jgi:hypothetical protein
VNIFIQKEIMHRSSFLALIKEYKIERKKERKKEKRKERI